LLCIIIVLFLTRLIKERKFSIFDFQFSKIDKKKSSFVFGVWALALWGGLSIIWAGDKSLAVYWWLVLLEGLVLMFLLLHSKLGWRKLGWTLVVSGVLQSILAMVQFLNQQVVASKWLGMASQWPYNVGVVVIEEGPNRWLRAYGTFAHPNILGGFLVVCFLVALVLYLKHKPGLGKILSALSLVVILVGLFFSFSRGAWLGLALALAIYFIFNKNKLIDWIRIFVYLLLILLVLFFAYQPLVMTRLSGQQRLEVRSAEQRVELVSESKQMIKDHWLVGVGMGNYTNELYKNNPDQEAWDYQPVHNLFLLVWAELGIVGLVIFIFLVLYIFMLAVRGLKGDPLKLSLLLAILVIAFVDHYLWTSYFGMLFLWFVLAMILRAKSGVDTTGQLL